MWFCLWVNPEARLCLCTNFAMPQSFYLFFLSTITSFLFHFLLPLILLTRQAKLTDLTGSNINPPAPHLHSLPHSLVINILTSNTSVRPFPGNGPVKMLIDAYFLAIRSVISQFTSWVLDVLLILMFQCYLSPLQFLSSKTDCAIENQGDLNLDEMDKENYTSFFLRLFLLSFSFLLLFVFSLPSLSHAFRRGRAALGLSGNR